MEVTKFRHQIKKFIELLTAGQNKCFKFTQITEISKGNKHMLVFITSILQTIMWLKKQQQIPPLSAREITP